MLFSTINPTTIIAIVIAIIIIAIIASGYVKAPTDKAYIISGLKKNPKVLIGRAGIKIPFLERKDELVLKQISIDIKTEGHIPTKDFIGVDIDAVAKVRVITYKDVEKNDGCFTEEMARAAMRNFLNMDETQIIAALTDSLQGNMREIIGTQTLKDLCGNRKAFGDEIQAKAQPDMNALGIYIESCNIQKLTDEKDLIKSLGQDNMSQIQKDASIAKANADRDVAIAEATAAREANDAKVLSDTEIAQKQNELNIKRAELKKAADIKQAEADAAYQIQEETQRKTLEITRSDADIARQEKEIEVRQKAASVREQELDAEIKKKAEADKYKTEQEAQADLFRRQREAEAATFEAQKEAEALKAKADAAKYQAEQEAAGIRAKGIAEAEAIKAKGIAEAEAIDKKAEAMAKMQDAAILEMFFNVLPDVAKNVAAPLQSVDKITMYGEGNTSKLIEDITKATTQVTSGIADGMGVDIRAMLMEALNRKKKATEQTAESDVDSFKEVDDLSIVPTGNDVTISDQTQEQ